MTYVATGPTAASSGTARRGGAVPDRRPEHVRDGALARAPHGPPQAARRRRPVPRARVGELRDHRGRLHRLPRPLGRRVVRAGRARRASAAQPLPLHRVRDGRLEPAARDAPGLGRSPAGVPLVGARSRADARSSRRSGGGSTSTCSTSTRTSTSVSSSAAWRRRMNLEVPISRAGRVRGLRARRALLLRPGARLRDRRREPDRLASHGALRPERGRQVVAPPCERRPRAP